MLHQMLKDVVLTVFTHMIYITRNLTFNKTHEYHLKGDVKGEFSSISANHQNILHEYFAQKYFFCFVQVHIEIH